MKTNFIFDLYGTLVDIHTDEEKPEAWKALARFYSYYGAGYTPAELKEEYRKLTGELTAGREGLRRDSHEAFPEIQIEEVFLELFRAKGGKVSPELAVYAGQFFRAMTTDWLRLYDGTREMLENLRDRGGRLYLLSNAQQIFTEYEMKALGIYGFFDAVYLSSSCRCKKPDLRFFRMILEEQKLNPKDCIMTGNDGACDIEGAKRAGMSTLYVRSGLSPEEDFPDADFILEEMDMKKIQKILLSEL